jgi:hypothetical protein
VILVTDPVRTTYSRECGRLGGRGKVARDGCTSVVRDTNSSASLDVRWQVLYLGIRVRLATMCWLMDGNATFLDRLPRLPRLSRLPWLPWISWLCLGLIPWLPGRLKVGMSVGK